MSVISSGRAAWAGLLLAVAWLSPICTLRAADADTAQRQAFMQAYAAAQAGDVQWHTLAAGLTDYPLYPYLEAAALEHDLRRLDQSTVEAYLRRYPDWLPADDLRRDFLLELARRQDWSGFSAMYRQGLGDTLACDALQAKLSRGEALDFDADLATLWTRAALPSSCDPVLRAAQAQGLLTAARLWARIDDAAAAGQGGTVAALAGWLPADQAAGAQAIALALRDPAAAVGAASKWPDASRYRQAATLALTQLARRQASSADQTWQDLQGRFAFSVEQRNQVLHALALFHATDFDDHALAGLVALPAAAQSEATRAWRARVALARQSWPAVLAAIEAMPESERQDGEWRYFRARALAATGHETEAREDYAGLADQATFFGFLAADQVRQPYALCPATLATDPQRERDLLANPGLRRAFELYAVDLPAYARREWTRALRGSDEASKRVAAKLANQRGWYDRAVFTYNSGDALQLYDLRFPLASQDGLVVQAREAGIYPPWAYGILRAESAWMSDARSGADARGLMQLLPSTAARVAKSNGLPWGGAQSLYDPDVNIVLGTRYLAQVAARFDGSPWLASAAYNAGPNRVAQWIAARGGLAPDIFVATIPYKETREYVARVMAFSVIYDWRLHGDAVPLSIRMNAIGQPYAVPDAQTPRTAVTCPAPTPAPAATQSPVG
ncbi:MAG: transglycosylase SLT domain-containing protein [Xanthomonadales bacterium]|nr:transglycosylase SLT domain-containing protein [Xanthomonadales bacterium]